MSAGNGQGRPCDDSGGMAGGQVPCYLRDDCVSPPQSPIRAVLMLSVLRFGMGIDKANVRYVIHYSLSQSLEAYYQVRLSLPRDEHPS
jgi:hypothetical protein